MSSPPSPYPNLRLLDHPLIQHKLARVRAASTGTADFRRLLHEIAALMVFEVCADLPTEPVTVETPLETTTCRRLSEPVTLVPILRAGLGMMDGLRSLLPEARVGHIGLFRDEASLEPVSYYVKLPAQVERGISLLVDPMLATGGSASEAVRILHEHGARDVRLVCLVAAPEGVLRMLELHPEVPVHAAALDRQLDERGYIRPGLGDAGDRIFGTH